MGWNENFNRKKIEELVMGLASGRKMLVVLKEMKIDWALARRMLRQPLGQRVIQEMQELQALQRGLAQGKAAQAAEEVEVEDEAAGEEALEMPTEMTEEARAALRAEVEAMERAEAEGHAG